MRLETIRKIARSAPADTHIKKKWIKKMDKNFFLEKIAQSAPAAAYTYTYTHIYIQRESARARERERERET